MLEIIETLGIDISYLNQDAGNFLQELSDEHYDTGQINPDDARSVSQGTHHSFTESDLLRTIEEIQYACTEQSSSGEISSQDVAEATDVIESITSQLYGHHPRGEDTVVAGPAILNIANGRIEIESDLNLAWAFNQPAEKLPALVTSISTSLSEAIELANESNDVLGNLAKAQLISVLEQAKKEISDPYVDKPKWEDRKNFLAGIRMAAHKVKKSGVSLSESTTKLFQVINDLVKQLETFLDWFR